MRVIVTCEESQRVCQAFRDRGHDALSCDILPTSGQHPEWHLQMDAIEATTMRWGEWNMIIGFPPCDHLAVSGARWFPEKRAGGRQRAAIKFFLDLWEAPVSKIALENPIGIMSGKREYLKKWYPDLYERAKMLPEPQIIQPWQFGHGETKATCLWLKGLPKLVPTNIVDGRDHRVHRMAPGPNRARDRARTYPGIAEAMAKQWGDMNV